MFNLFKRNKTLQPSTLPQVIIHIGSPKTGSSAIQKYLLENRISLIDLGIYYPEHGLDENGISGGHSNIGRRLIECDIKGAQDLFNQYAEQARRKNCTLLLSAESFYIRAEEFKEITAQTDYKIISFLRDPLESIYSNYNQGIKRNYSTTRLETLCKNLAQRPAEFYSGKVLEKWVELHGKDKITIIKYNQEQFRKTPIQRVFLQSLGLDSKNINKHLKFNTKFINNSYTLAALELKRMFNFVLDQKETKKNHEIDWFLQGVSDKTNKSTKHYALKDRISNETYNLLANSFNIENLSRKQKESINLNDLNNEIFEIFKQLEQAKPKIFKYIHTQLTKHLKSDHHTFEVLKLAELFNLDVNQFDEKELWFKPHQLQNMPNAQAVDFLRDIAYQCYYRGDLENAELLIEKALEIRPKGPAIIKLAEQIKKDLNVKTNL
jgi:hypothetical protein